MYMLVCRSLEAFGTNKQASSCKGLVTTLVSAHTSFMNTGKRGIIGYASIPTQGAYQVKKLGVEWKINTLKRAGVGIETIKEREISTQPLFCSRQPNIKLRRPTHTVPKTCKISASPTQRCSENKEATCITTSRNKCERPPYQTAYGSSRPLMFL